MKSITSILFVLVGYFASAQFQTNSSGNWNNPSTWQGNVVPNSTTADIEIRNGHTITLNTNIAIRNITISQGSLLLGNNTMAIYGVVDGIDKDNLVSNTNTELQIMGGAEVAPFVFSTQIQKLKKLVMSRKQGAISYHSIDLDDGVPADGIVLVLQLGVLYLFDESILYLNSKQIQGDIPCSDSSHVDGIVQRNIPKNSGLFTFPVGNKGVCRPFGVGLQNGNSDNINQVRFLYETPIQSTNVNYNNLPGGIIQYFYWKHSVVSGANPQRRLHYNNDDFPGISSQERVQSMTLANTDGSSAWDKATTPWSVNDDSQWVEFDNANASNNEYWTLGSVMAEVNYEDIDLPIELVSFDAHILTLNQIELRWVTAQEIQNHYFVMFRSVNGIDFFAIDTILTQGNTREFSYYEHIDELGNIQSAIVYYKLKQVDFDGNFSESAIIEVLLPVEKQIQVHSIECKPLDGCIFIHIDLEQEPLHRIVVCDIQGNVHYTCTKFIEYSSFYTMQLPVMGNSIYVVHIQQSNTLTSKRIFVPAL